MLTRLVIQQERVIEIVLGLQRKMHETPPPPTPPDSRRWPLTVSDTIKLIVAAFLLGSAITGKLTPADLLAILK
jgi:hypothetical protein